MSPSFFSFRHGGFWPRALSTEPNRTDRGSHNVHPIKLSPSPWSYVTTRRGRRTVAERYVSLVTVTARDEHLNVGLAPSLLASPLPGNEKRHTVQRIHTTTEVYCRRCQAHAFFILGHPEQYCVSCAQKKEERKDAAGNSANISSFLLLLIRQQPRGHNVSREEGMCILGGS